MSAEVGIAHIGPEMHGTRMSLAEFAPAECEPGYSYELERGVVVVDMPRLPHSVVVRRIRRALELYDATHPGRIFHLAGGIDSVIRVPSLESERHPGVTVYLHPPVADVEDPWDSWIPELVMEVVSRSSMQRDYEIKREEYLRAGVSAYAILDPLAGAALLLTRHDDAWRDTRFDSADVLPLPMLPGFALPLAEIFAPIQ